MSPWTHVIGWTLIHFVWQGAVLAVVAAGALRLYRHRAANARYAIACVTLATMLASATVTALALTRDVSVTPVVRQSRTTAAPVIASAGARSWTENGISSLHSVLPADIDGLLPVIVFVWLVGVTMLLGRMTGGLWHVRRYSFCRSRPPLHAGRARLNESRPGSACE